MYPRTKRMDNDATTHYRSKLSSKEIEDIVQCGHSVVARRREIWERTGDVEKICKRERAAGILSDLMTNTPLLGCHQIWPSVSHLGSIRTISSHLVNS